MAYQAVTRSELKTKTSPRPGVRAFHDVVCFAMHAKGVRSGGIYNRRSVRGGLSWSLHAVGRAADFMCATKAGDELFLRCVAAAKACGISEVIWKRQRWTAEKGVRPYRGSNPHLDHVHVGFTVDFADRPNTPDLRKWVAHFMFP